MANSTSSPEGIDKSDRDGDRGEGQGTSVFEENRKEAGADYDFLSVIAVAEERDQAFKGSLQKNRYRKAYDALHSRHSEGSKYIDPNWRRKRSSIFVPRTRTVMRKNAAALAASMFTSPDSIVVESEAKNNPVRSAAAAVLQQCLNYRLDRTSAKSGIPWFLVVSGAHQDSQATGICYTKQFWEFETVTEAATEIVHKQHYYEGSNDPVLDPNTGEPVLEQEEKDVSKEYVTKDRPQSINYAPDNVMIDPTAYWISPEQRSGYLILRNPITHDDARVMLQNPGKGNEKWLDVPDAVLERVQEDYTSKGVRTARASDRTDPYEGRDGTSGGKKAPRSNIVWLYECFIRVEGVDYHFWSLGARAYASKVRTTRQAYPEQMGDRPVTRGYANIETYETNPDSPVELIAELQRELNDIRNLRIDTMKQALSPIAKVKQGTMFDFKQLQNRSGENTTIVVRNMDDLTFDRTPDVGASAYQETAQINADMDDLASVFAPSSVDTNRRLNETVGGMQLMNSSSNSVNEYDTRTFIETWAEPTLRQIVRLEQYYESDETVLAIAGDRAKLERFGVDSITDRDLEHEVSVRVNAGLGSADPIQKLQKLKGAMSVLAPMMSLFNKMTRVNAEEAVKEVMGLAGYHDGSRLFVFEDGPPPPPAPILKMQAQDKDRASKETIAKARDETVLQREHMRETFGLLAEILKIQGTVSAAAATPAPTGGSGGAKPMALSGAFKDLPPEAQAQALAQIGIFVHPDTIRQAQEQIAQREAAQSAPAAPARGGQSFGQGSDPAAIMAALSGLLAPSTLPPDAFPPPPQPGQPPGPGGPPGGGPPGGAPPGGPPGGPPRLMPPGR